tara:strand:- start:902 stop:1843 length:942 start_codon:yes stop_codon:yes gene_type:complete
MKKIGIIGTSDGNGHPYSYSAIFNGFDEYYLKKYCKFKLIKEYLPRYCSKKNLIKGAKVTSIWTQNYENSKKISKASLIPNVEKNFKDFIGKVDGVIIARDDVEKHLYFASFFLERNIPIFIDKQIVYSKSQLLIFLKKIKKKRLFMACSGIRYNKKLIYIKKTKKLNNVKTIHGTSHSNLMTYGHHLLEAVTVLFGTKVKSVKSLSQSKNHDIIQITYYSGLNVILEFIKNLSLPIKLDFFSANEKTFSIHFDDFYFSFKRMLEDFILMIENKNYPIPANEIINISKIILAGDISKRMYFGQPVSPKTLKKY